MENTVTLNRDLLHHRLVHAVTQYDIKESKKRYYNRYALPQYLAAVNNAEEQIAHGVSVRTALVKSFSGRLLDVTLRAVGEEKSTRTEQME